LPLKELTNIVSDVVVPGDAMR